jgi:hypothetical protein
MQIKQLIEDLTKYHNPEDHVAVHLWCAEDVLEKAGEENVKLSRDDVNEILDDLHNHIDSEYGLCWDTVQSCIEKHLEGK